MASRLYRTPGSLYLHVWQALARLQLRSLGTPTLLPRRCHDAHNRLLRLMPGSTRRLMGLLIAFARGLDQEGYLVLDEVIVEKAFAKRLPWAGNLYSFAKKRKVWGIQIIVLVWCSTAGQWRIPVGFRLWRPKRSCRAQRYQTKLELAVKLVTAVVAAKLPVSYLVGDTHYTAGWFTKRLARLGWHGTLDPKTMVIWRGKRHSVHDLSTTLKLKWRAHLGLRAVALTIFAPKYGHLRLVVTRNCHGNYDYLVSNDQSLDLTTMAQRNRSRWSVETVFRDSKQFAGLAACQCWVDQAMVRHVTLVFLTFVVLQLLPTSSDETVAAVKERWQLIVLRNGELPPEPLRACPSHLRLTA